MALTIGLQTADGPLGLAAPNSPREGVRLAGAVAMAPARRTRVELWPSNGDAVQAVRLAGDVIPLGVTVDAGELVVQSDPPGCLRGKFDLRLSIDDLVVARGRWARVEIAKGGQGHATLQASLRDIRVNVDELDPAVRAVVNGVSRVDGLPLERWLLDPLTQAKRKACLLNLLAVLRATDLGLCHALEPLLEVFVADTGHVSARADARLLRLVSEEARLGERNVRARVFDDFGVHASHKRALVELAQRLGEPEPVTFESYRFEGRPSMQIVFGVPAGVATAHLVDVDLDLGNPRQDLLGLVVHVGELFDDGLDHVKLREKLVKGPAGPFINYVPV